MENPTYDGVSFQPNHEQTSQPYYQENIYISDVELHDQQSSNAVTSSSQLGDQDEVVVISNQNIIRDSTAPRDVDKADLNSPRDSPTGGKMSEVQRDLGEEAEKSCPGQEPREDSTSSDSTAPQDANNDTDPNKADLYPPRDPPTEGKMGEMQQDLGEEADKSCPGQEPREDSTSNETQPCSESNEI